MNTQRFEQLRRGAVEWLQPEKPKIKRVGGLLGFERLRFKHSVAGASIVGVCESTHLFTREKTGFISVADFTNGDRAMVKWHEDQFFVKSSMIRSPDKVVALPNLTGPQEELIHSFVALALASAMVSSS